MFSKYIACELQAKLTPLALRVCERDRMIDRCVRQIKETIGSTAGNLFSWSLGVNVYKYTQTYVTQFELDVRLTCDSHCATCSITL